MKILPSVPSSIPLNDWKSASPAINSDCLDIIAQRENPREASRLCVTKVLEVETTEEEAGENLNIVLDRVHMAEAMAVVWTRNELKTVALSQVQADPTEEGRDALLRSFCKPQTLSSVHQISS